MSFPLNRRYEKQKEEAQAFEAFLQAFPSLKASITSWEPAKKDPPDILCHTEPGETVGFELGEWLHEAQMKRSKIREKLENEILSAIGEQGENTTKHIYLVKLILEENVKQFHRRDSEGLKDELYQLIAETDKAWPKHREWHTAQGYRCEELDRYKILKQYFSHVCFYPIQTRSEIRKKPSRAWIQFPVRSGSYSSRSALEALHQMICKKATRYESRKNIPFDLILYYCQAYEYNTPLQDISVRTFADAARIAAEITTAEFQGIQHPFRRVYLLNLYSKPEAFCVYPEYQECH